MKTELIMAPSCAPEDISRDLCDALRYEQSLIDFTAAFWRFVEPRSFQSNWHIEAICDHLEAVADRQIKRGLLINIPPRHMKSLGANVFFPAWVWAQNPNPDNDLAYPFQVRRGAWRGPGVKFMHLSYDSKLATRDGTKCRQIITSPLYQRLWGHRVRLQPDQNQKTRFDNLAGGNRISTSEGGVITGEGGELSLSLTIRTTSVPSAAPATLPGKTHCASGTDRSRHGSTINNMACSSSLCSGHMNAICLGTF